MDRAYDLCAGNGDMVIWPARQHCPDAHAAPDGARRGTDDLGSSGANAVLAVAGGLLVLSLRQRVPAQHRPVALTWSAFGVMWTNRLVRRPVLGYFGHMWELYTFWVLLPFILATRISGDAVLWWSFAVMGSGALGCVWGGAALRYFDGAKIAATHLSISGLCCLLAPLMLHANDTLFFLWLLIF